jgi:hypothetical protein
MEREEANRGQKRLEYRGKRENKKHRLAVLPANPALEHTNGRDITADMLCTCRLDQ